MEWQSDAPSYDTPMSDAPLIHALVFEFWDDHAYQSYASDEQTRLSRLLFQVPCPSEVFLSGDRYYLQNFNEVQKGKAVQVNKHTKFQRAVRLKPPYAFKGASVAPVASSDFYVEFKDTGGLWRSYSQSLTAEIRLFAKCAPPPERVFFCEGGNLYWLTQLDALLFGNGPAYQINVRTNIQREVRLTLDLPRSPLASSSSKTVRRSPTFSLSNARIMKRREGGHRGTELRENEMRFILEHWRRETRPETLTIPCTQCSDIRQQQTDLRGLMTTTGGLCVRAPGRCTCSIVQKLHELEIGNATIICPEVKGLQRVWQRHKPMCLDLLFDIPTPGAVVLPADLSEETFDLCSFGRDLTKEEITGLVDREDGNKCLICLCDMEIECTNLSNCSFDDSPTNVFQLECGHAFHKDCLTSWFENKRRCPQCLKEYGVVTGSQPRSGKMEWHTEAFSLPGHADASNTMVVQFEFLAGTDSDGTAYEGRRCKAFLPGNAQGIILLELFKLAFKRRVMFGLGSSMTFGLYRPTFNIHIKTSTNKGIAGHGYPDKSYYQRATEELQANGVTIMDLPF